MVSNRAVNADIDLSDEIEIVEEQKKFTVQWFLDKSCNRGSPKHKLPKIEGTSRKTGRVAISGMTVIEVV